MIIYSPLDGQAITYSINTKAKHCFLMTRLGTPVPPMVKKIRRDLKACCRPSGYKVIDAATTVTGRDFLLKIWHQIASTPLSVVVLHEDFPESTQANIFYELGVAQALGKETVIIKSPKSKVPSDFTRTEHIVFDKNFSRNFKKYLNSIYEAAVYYETVGDILDRNPILALDYLKRAYLINGENRLKRKAKKIAKTAGLEDRAGNSVELIAATF